MALRPCMQVESHFSAAWFNLWRNKLTSEHVLWKKYNIVVAIRSNRLGPESQAMHDGFQHLSYCVSTSSNLRHIINFKILIKHKHCHRQVCSWAIEVIANHQYRAVGRAITCSSLKRVVWGSNLGPVKSDVELPTARHRCNISSKETVLPGGHGADMSPANSLHVSA